MKICLINNLYPPYNRGGAEKVCLKMAHDLKKENHEVFIITTKPKKPNLEKSTNDDIFYINSDFYNLNKKSIPTRLLWHFTNIFAFKKYNRILEILKSQEPDLVITHNLMGLGFMTAPAIKLSRIPHHHFLHDIQLLHPSGLMIFNKENKLNSLLAKGYRFFTKKMMDSPDLIISPSRWLVKLHQEYNFFQKSKIEIRPFREIFSSENKDKEKMEEKRDLDQHTNHIKKDNNNNSSSSSSSKINLLFAGQIEEHKGIIFLIKAFQKMADDNMILKIAGSGSSLKKAQKISGDNKKIIFLGNLKKEELFHEMTKAQILVVPSLCYENSPLIINEARNLGLKIVASNIGGIPEAISDNDLLFTPASEKDLFSKIHQLLDNSYIK